MHQFVRKGRIYLNRKYRYNIMSSFKRCQHWLLVADVTGSVVSGVIARCFCKTIHPSSLICRLYALTDRSGRRTVTRDVIVVRFRLNIWTKKHVFGDSALHVFLPCQVISLMTSAAWFRFFASPPSLSGTKPEAKASSVRRSLVCESAPPASSMAFPSRDQCWG